MKIKQSMVLAILIASQFSELKAQSNSGPIDPRNIFQNAIPAGPDVAMQARYSMCPPNYSNGLPQQNIPLYTLKENGVSFPLKLFYSYSGFRVKEGASAVGLGWGITEGTIIRIVKHVADEYTPLMKKFGDFGDELVEETGSGYHDHNFHIANTLEQLTFNYTQNRLFYKYYDAQPDLYIYNFGDYSGKFFWINGKAILLEHDDIEIDGITENGQTKFTIKTPDGTDYFFTEMDRVTYAPPITTTPSFCDVLYKNSSNVDDGYTSAWRLTKIYNRVKKSFVDFQYDYNETEMTHKYGQVSSITFPATTNVQGNYFSTDFVKDEMLSYTRRFDYFTKEINSNHYRIVFDLEGRKDDGNNSITGLRVFDNENLDSAIFTVKFNKGYFGDTSNIDKCWLKLKGVAFKGLGRAEEYKFSYYEENSVGPDKNSLSIDHWGYYNAVLNTTLIPFNNQILSFIENETNLSTGVISWALRDPDLSFAKYYSLKSVLYPTGGSTRIEYESANGVGIRVKSQEDFDGQQNIRKYYDYGPNIEIVPSYAWSEYFTYKSCEDDYDLRRYTTFSSNLINPADYYSESDNFYDDVIEYIDSGGINVGFSEYKYNRIPETGNKVLLIEKSDFRSGNRELVKRIKYGYGIDILRNIQVWRIPELLSIVEPGNFCNVPPDEGPSCGYVDPEKYYILGDFNGGIDQIPCMWIHLDELETLESGIVRRTSYGYAAIDSILKMPPHTRPVLIKEDLSTGGDRLVANYYPGDTDPEDSSLILGIPSMYNPDSNLYMHYTSPVMKELVYYDSLLISKSENSYALDLNDSLINLSQYRHWTGDNESSLKKWSFDYDDYGNMIEMCEEYNSCKALIWDGPKRSVIAMCENANSNEIAYTSFEDDSFGNWDYISGNYTFSLNSITGSRFFNGTLSKVVPKGDYFVYAWTKSYIIVNGISSLELTPINFSKVDTSWKFYVWNIENADSISVVGNSIDELRLFPIHGRMTSFVISPFVGVICSSDLNGKISYFSYDDFGRLVLVRDNDGYILKKYCYNYAGQQEDCMISATAAWQPTGQSRCKPCPADSNYNIGVLQVEEMDMNPGSETYNQLRWRDTDSSGTCTIIADWQNTTSALRCQTSSGNNTGYQEQEQIDRNPCSSTYNETRWITAGYDSTACPLPVVCSTGNCNIKGPDYKCVNGNCERGTKVITDAYYSSSQGGNICVYHYEWSDGSWSANYSQFTGMFMCSPF